MVKFQWFVFNLAVSVIVCGGSSAQETIPVYDLEPIYEYEGVLAFYPLPITRDRIVISLFRESSETENLWLFHRQNKSLTQLTHMDEGVKAIPALEMPNGEILYRKLQE